MDADDLDELYRQYYPRLVRRLALVVGDLEEAKDLAQQAFLRATEHGESRTSGDPMAWLTVIGFRLAIDERRRRKRWGFVLLSDSHAEWALGADPDLWRAMSALDRNTRAALVLTSIGGYTHEEVARALGVPRGTVSSWLSRARTKLRPLLEDDPNAG